MTFLDHYLNYSTSNEAPLIYHKWAALSALSHLIGPRVWTHMGGALTHYPNMYILLTGNPGVMKSTAMKQAERILKLGGGVTIAPTAASKEAISQLMGRKDSPCLKTYLDKDEKITYSQLAVFSEEIVSLLNAAGNANITVEFLVDIWGRVDNAYEELFKNTQGASIKRPYLSILACLTPETLKSLVTSKVVSSGMSRRCLFIHANLNGEPHAFIEVSDDQQNSWEQCASHARSLSTIVGSFEWDPDAREAYQSWYVPFKKRIGEVQSSVLQRFYQSKAEYTIKVSMLLGIAQMPPLLRHSKKNFLDALQMVTEVERGACMLFDTAGRNELAEITADVEGWLRDHPTEHPEAHLITIFFKNLQRPAEEMRIILEQLERTKKIKIRLAPGVGIVPRFITYVGETH